MSSVEDRGGTVPLGDLSAGIAQLVGDASSGCSCPDCVPDEISGLATDLGADEAEDVVETLASSASPSCGATMPS